MLELKPSAMNGALAHKSHHRASSQYGKGNDIVANDQPKRMCFAADGLHRPSGSSPRGNRMRPGVSDNITPHQTHCFVYRPVASRDTLSA